MRCSPVLLALAGCGGASAELGLDAWMRVEGAQYQPGALPAESTGPAVAGTFLSRPRIHPLEMGRPLRGALEPDGTAVVLGLAGDAGHWIAVAGLPDVVTPELPSVNLLLSFAADLPLGEHAIVLHAVDAGGQVGPATRLPVTATPRAMPEGSLVFSLVWDRNADLDLHVVDPNGVEIYKSNINSYVPPAPGMPDEGAGPAVGGKLDFDSNAACVIDGRRQENVLWPLEVEPPAGTYTVRVDTFSLCGETAAHWKVDVLHHDRLVGAAEGTSTWIDATTPHGLGAGQLALQVQVP